MRLWGKCRDGVWCKHMRTLDVRHIQMSLIECFYFKFYFQCHSFSDKKYEHNQRAKCDNSYSFCVSLSDWNKNTPQWDAACFPSELILTCRPHLFPVLEKSDCFIALGCTRISFQSVKAHLAFAFFNSEFKCCTVIWLILTFTSKGLRLKKVILLPCN